MEPELQRLALGPTVAGIQDEADWILKVCELDFTCRENREAISGQVQRMIRRTAASSAVAPPYARRLTPNYSAPTGPSRAGAPNLRSTNSSLALPTANEIRILSRHNGCLK